MLIHGPDLVKAVLVTLLESLEFVLQLLKLFGEFLIIVSELDVLALKVFRLSLELLLNCTQYVLIASLFGLEGGNCVAVDLFSFLKYLMVELKLLLVESIYGFHVLHALLENLHFLLELDFLFGLVVGVL